MFGMKLSDKGTVIESLGLCCCLELEFALKCKAGAAVML